MYLKNKACCMVQLRDITEIKKLAKLSAQNKMLTMFTSSVTHEMITPLKCATQLAININSSSKDKNS